MKRPSFQFYPADWRNNAKLRRCSEAARGAWVDILCVLHDSDEYGVCRWPLVDLARSAGVPLKYAKELVEKGVLKGADKSAEPYIYTPRHAGRNGEPVMLVTPGDGPCWYCSRFVRDEWVRERRGNSTRFTQDNQPTKGAGEAQPMLTPKEGIGDRQGDGPTSSSSTSLNKTPLPPSGELRWSRPDWIPADLWQQFEEVRRRKKKPLTDAARKLAVNRLDKLRAEGHDVATMLNDTILHAWDTFYAPKEGAAQAATNHWEGAI